MGLTPNFFVPLKNPECLMNSKIQRMLQLIVRKSFHSIINVKTLLTQIHIDFRAGRTGKNLSLCSINSHSNFPHYSKSQIFVQKFNFDKATTFSRVFHPKNFWQFFSWNQSCQQLKSPKPQHFHEFFTQIGSTIFSGNQSWIFGQKLKILNSVRGWYWHSYFKYLSS